ncbi:hypothetical protein Pla8534_19060 [Lignipirellula cremea]|uniref:Uncharacterized protein n=2 Tax=Lignipirellula cremea TaxID=2528010 RepID=A0A518DQK1_9BACT|nr:hypothetical protein Pla8534_19060 [Lignipirellula cremea]
MAKKRGSGPNKSQTIRDLLAKTPDASANEIAAAASKQLGEEVKPGLVYSIKSAQGGSKKKAAKKKTAKPAVGQAPSPSSNGGVDLNLIKEAAALLSHAGGPQAAQAALAAATEISKVLGK